MSTNYVNYANYFCTCKIFFRTVACLFMLAMMAIAITHGFVCPVNICSQVECSDELTEKTCDGELIPNSSFCGCCTTCVKYIGKLFEFN